MGMSFHGHLIHPGLMSDFRLGTFILDMYLKFGEVESVKIIFEKELLQKSLISWSSLLTEFSQNRFDMEAVFLFQHMHRGSNMKPDSITIADVVPACARLADLQMIQLIHSIIIKNGLNIESDIVIGTSMVDAYGKCLDIKAATFLFTCTRKPSAAIRNAMISGYNLNDNAHKGMELFLEMLRFEVLPDSITMVLLFQSSGELGSLRKGSILHGYYFSKGFSSHLTICNAMMDMYIRCGCLKSSQVLLDLLPCRNIVSWNTMLCGYIRVGFPTMVFDRFHQLQWESQHRPDPVTLISFIRPYATDSTDHGGAMTHSLVMKLGFNSETLVIKYLIDPYAKNGQIYNAWSLFEQMGLSKDNSSWNVMLAGIWN